MESQIVLIITYPLSERGSRVDNWHCLGLQKQKRLDGVIMKLEKISP